MYSAIPQTPTDWVDPIDRVRQRFEREFRQEPFELPPEVEAMPIFRQWVSRELTPKAVSPFWELAKIQKNHRCLDIGCGVSFLVYGWRDWQAYFYGQEICRPAQAALAARGPQLNSKLFKGVKLGPAHQLDYPGQMFDRVIATGFSCYYPLDYWQQVLKAVKPLLKPDGLLVFDALNPQGELAENWAILETYLGAEVLLSPLADYTTLVKDLGGKVSATRPGELFQLYQVKFS
jgi:SAM-dependent methyltransferase